MRRKRKLDNFRTRNLFKYGYPVDSPFRFNLNQKQRRFQNNLDSLLCEAMCNSFLTALHVVITTCTHAQTLDRCVEASRTRWLRLPGRRLQITPACLQVNARAIFRVFAFTLVFADERMEQAKREEVRMKEEKSRSGKVVE